MSYNSVTYNFDKKNGRYRFYYESEYIESLTKCKAEQK